MKKLYFLFIIPRIYLLAAFSGTLILFIAGGQFLHAQTTVTNGTTLVISNGSTLVSNGDFIIKNGANVDVQGTLDLKSDLINEHAVPDNLGTGTVEFSGSAYQSVSGQNTIQDMTVDNSAATIGIAGNTVVNGTLAFTNGIITPQTSHFTLGPSSTVSGTPSATKMFAPKNTGEVRKEFPGGYTGSFTFPVGDTVGIDQYSPVSVSVQSGTFGGGNYIGVRVTDAQYPEDSITTSYITRYWTMSDANITNLAASPTFIYLNADVVGTETDIYTMKMGAYYTTSIAYNKTNAGANTLSAAGVSGFSDWTGAAGFGGLPPYTHSLQGIYWNAGTHCYDGREYIYIAGNGTAFTIDPVASVTHIAGNAIYYLPGTTVNSGGYMLGQITTTNTFCASPENMLVANTDRDGNSGLEDNLFKSEGKNIKVYPNPTYGTFTLELSGDFANERVYVTVYGMTGEYIFQETLVNTKKHDFSLEGFPVGIYLVRVHTGELAETTRILKH